MGKKVMPGGLLALLAIITVIAGNTLELSDFLSGLLTGIGIVAAFVGIYLSAKVIKEGKES